MTPLDEAEHAAASGDPAAALRDTRAAEVQWREYGFGPWAIRDLRDEGFLGGAELRFAGDGIEGIAPDAQRQVAKRPDQGQLLEDQRARDPDPTRQARPAGSKPELTHPTPCKQPSAVARSDGHASLQ
jgi:hypothetical protein